MDDIKQLTKERDFWRGIVLDFMADSITSAGVTGAPSPRLALVTAAKLGLRGVFGGTATPSPRKTVSIPHPDPDGTPARRMGRPPRKQTQE